MHSKSFKTINPTLLFFLFVSEAVINHYIETLERANKD